MLNYSAARPSPMHHRRRRQAHPVFSTSVRLPPEVVERIDFIIANEPRVASRSEAIVLALDHWLGAAEASIRARKAS
jgi:hypothetical protein